MARKKTSGRPTDWEFSGLAVPGSKAKYDITLPQSEYLTFQAAYKEAARRVLAMHAEAVEEAEQEAAAPDSVTPVAPVVDPELEALRAENADLRARLEAAASTPVPDQSGTEFDPMAAASVAVNLAMLLDRQAEISKRLEADLEQAQQLADQAAASAAAAETSRQASLGLADNLSMILQGKADNLMARANAVEARTNDLDGRLGQLAADASAHRELINRAGSLVQESREEIVSLAAQEFAKVAEELRTDINILGGVVGASEESKEMFLNRTALAGVGSSIQITEADRARFRAAQAQAEANDDASDLQARTRLDLQGASVENGGGRMADHQGVGE